MQHDEALSYPIQKQSSNKRSVQEFSAARGGSLTQSEQSDGPFLDRLYGDPKARCLQYGTETPQFWIAGLGEHFVGRLARELRFAGDVGDAALCLGHLAQREHDRGLVSILKHGFEVRRGFGGGFQPLDQPGFIGKARRRAASLRCAI